MSSSNSRIIIWGLALGIGAVLITFLLTNVVSPIYNDDLSGRWGRAQIPMFFIVILLRPTDAGSHMLVYLAAFLQWFVIGSGLRFIASSSK